MLKSRSLRTLLALTLGLVAGLSPAADQPTAIQLQRADKIVAALALPDTVQATRVRDLIARHYADLAAIHDPRDAAIKAARANPDKTAANAAIAEAKAAAEPRIATLHADFLSRLAVELTPTQIDQVKDGLTYGVLPLTFRVYQEMLPQLTTEQKAQILAWLTEAREHAMDGSTSDEKHAWFGKYKGRINNYLAKAGIDMKQAEKDMMERKKAGTH
jgi:thioesterase domain-containing protein